MTEQEIRIVYNDIDHVLKIRHLLKLTRNLSDTSYLVFKI